MPIVARPGEKLIIVAPFVGYTSDALRFNVAGRIQEALSDEIARAKLADTRLALWPAAIGGMEEATQARADSAAALLIWGEYDAGRVRAIVTMPGDQGSSWVNPVASPADLPLVINEQVPQSARVFALYALGQLYRKEQDTASALKLFESALRLDPKDPQTKAALHFYVGTLLPEVQGRTPEVISQAISHFDAALALRPAWSNLRYNRGTAYLGRALLSLAEGADLDDAIADFGQVIAAQPWQEDPYLNRGIAYYQRNRPGDMELAMADFGQAIEIAPEDDRGYYHRALAAIRAGDEEVWVADLTRGQAISPGYAPILNAWCWAYATTERPMEALPHCEAAVDADPTGTSLDSRALAYAQLGLHAEAAADFTAYLGVGAPDVSGLIRQISWASDRGLDCGAGGGAQSLHGGGPGDAAEGVSVGLSCRLRRLLYRHLHHLAHPRHAGWETGRRPLRAAHGGQPLPALRPAGAAGGLHRPASHAGDVRHDDGRGADLFDAGSKSSPRRGGERRGNERGEATRFGLRLSAYTWGHSPSRRRGCATTLAPRWNRGPSSPV